MKEITIDGIEYTLTPKAKEEEFTYPMWFKCSVDMCVYKFTSLTTCDTITPLHSQYIPHTTTNIWTQVPEPKKTKILYEWIAQFDETCAPHIIDIVLTEQDAKERFKRRLWYKKTGREFEVEI